MTRSRTRRTWNRSSPPPSSGAAAQPCATSSSRWPSRTTASTSGSTRTTRGAFSAWARPTWESAATRAPSTRSRAGSRSIPPTPPPTSLSPARFSRQATRPTRAKPSTTPCCWIRVSPTRPPSEAGCASGGSGRGGRVTAERPLERDRRDHGCHHHHDHHGREESVVDDAQPLAHAPEDETHLASRHHAEPDGEAVHGPRRHAADDLAEQGGEGEDGGQGHRARLREAREIHLHAHEEEEHGREDLLEGRHQAVYRLLPSLAIARARREVALAHDETGREGAHDGGKPDPVGEPPHQECEGEGEEQASLRRLQPPEGAHERPRHAVTDQDHRGHKEGGEDRDARYLPEVNAPGGDHARHYGEHDEAEHVIDHGGAQDEARLQRREAAQILEHSGGDPHARRGERRAHEE